jgi:murein L,D-transpeptidase YafK
MKPKQIKYILMIKGVFFVSLAFLFASLIRDNFLEGQKKYERVKTAYKEKLTFVNEAIAKKGIKIGELNILIVAYKAEQELIVYAKKSSDKRYQELLSYEICASSGVLGPKRKQGDGQVPEGFYKIDRYNPSSQFYLSLGLNYPNQSDKIVSKASDLGGDVFIHGECVTIGCMPMTNEKIKEIYLFAIQAHATGQTIPVYVFPFKMDMINMENYTKKYLDNKPLVNFWRNLKEGYDLFQKNKAELKPTVDKNGKYIFGN